MGYEEIVEAAIESIQVTTGRTFRPKNLWPTDFAEACPRYLALRILVINGELPTPPFEGIRAGLLGKWAHERVLRTLHTKGVLKDIEVKVQGKWDTSLITGKIDGVFSNPKHIFEYKTLNGKSFKRLQGLMPNVFEDTIIMKYNRQLQVYMSLMPDVELAVLLIHNTDDPDTKDSFIYLCLPRDEAVIKELQDTLDTAVTSLKAQNFVLPARKALVCPFCPFFEEHCNIIKFQPPTKSHDLVPHIPKAEKMCRLYKELDASITKSKKLQEVIRATLLGGLEKIGLATGIAGDYSVNVSQRSRAYYPKELIEPIAEREGIPQKVTEYKVLTVRQKPVNRKKVTEGQDSA